MALFCQYELTVRHFCRIRFEAPPSRFVTSETHGGYVGVVERRGQWCCKFSIWYSLGIRNRPRAHVRGQNFKLHVLVEI